MGDFDLGGMALPIGVLTICLTILFGVLFLGWHV